MLIVMKKLMYCMAFASMFAFASCGGAKTETTEEKVIRLKSRLSETDHMVVECYEYSMLGLEMPYDIVALHEERQAIKTEIENLQSE
jgi:hypothetical protein